MPKLNMRQTAVTWINRYSKGVFAPHVGNFPQKQTVTSEKIHAPHVWRNQRG